jgi:excisionase family DNA binding protein
MPDNISKLLPLDSVAALLAVSSHTIRAWVRHGKLRPLRICRRLLFEPCEVARFLSEARAVPDRQSASDSEQSL